MKIIRVDNYERESESDVLIAENVHKCYSSLIVNLLNKYCDDSDFFKLVEDNYKLYKFEP